MFKALLWAIFIKKEVRKDVDCQQNLYTYIKLIMKERKQTRQNEIKLTSNKIIITIPYAADDDENKM